jgi:cob(I)alamin adenosyltransferase
MRTYFTRSGDDGYTAQLGEGRVAKYGLRMEALGALDEANAALGLARSVILTPGPLSAIILAIQRDLYRVMAEVSATPENAGRFRTIEAVSVTWLETQIEAFSADLKVPAEFIIPGDTQSGALLDLARTVVRRAERRIAELHHLGLVDNIELLRYLNRLSSLIYVLELKAVISTDHPSPTLAK